MKKRMKLSNYIENDQPEKPQREINRFRELAAAIVISSKNLRRFQPQDYSKERCLAEIANQRSWYDLSVHIRDTYPWKSGPEYDARVENSLAAGKALERVIAIVEGLHPGLSIGIPITGLS